jgi:hypothetical protein
MRFIVAFWELSLILVHSVLCVEWHCANVGTGDGISQGKVVSATNEFCFQYYQNVSEG